MNLPDDMKHYRAPTDWDGDDLGTFQLLSRDVAFALLIAIAVFVLLFFPYIH